MRVKEVIIVEGKYDKIAVSSAVDANIVETSGFGIFSDKEKLNLIRRLAEKNGAVVLTDSDGAGFVIRNFLKGSVGGNIRQAYIPQIDGVEKRKKAPSKEHLLGVEGMKKEIIIDALKRAGATFDDGEVPEKISEITKTDMYLLGLSGGVGSAERRKKLLSSLNLPDKLSSNAMLEVLNALYSREEFYAMASAHEQNTTEA